MGKIDIASLSLDELISAFSKINLPKFRAKQVYEWIHKHFAQSFDEMTNINKSMRVQLNEQFEILSCTVERKLVSSIDGTIKYLYKMNDGEFVESVLMQYKHGYSICISTQVGCKMGCTFCASTIGGCRRNLSASEMLAQIYSAQRDSGVRISNIVLMGMGEPLDNYDNVMRFLNLVSDENGVNIGLRHISLSTCGIVPKIYELANKKLQLTLSLSLHAPNDELRSKTMPINRRWGVNEVIEACKYYFAQTGRRISFEYALIDGVNDGALCAAQLVNLLKGMVCHVNLIPVNTVAESGYRRSNKKNVKEFCDYLNDNGINTTVRRTLGSDINASCGQLRKTTMDSRGENT
ncbi:MAG: 23S rRNA (adenine(2503)-C(2))-methyltransferase RlmN [Clostridia bacterium]|nr:23S rRNA (adenine(2503)-C(2))-methyltransferase RlmN [Clostridia bacterium]